MYLESDESGPWDKVLVRLRDLKVHSQSFAKWGAVESFQALVGKIRIFFRIGNIVLIIRIVDPLVKKVPNVFICAVEEFFFETPSISVKQEQG